jgi:hypothetical protein
LAAVAALCFVLACGAAATEVDTGKAASATAKAKVEIRMIPPESPDEYGI